MRAKRMRVAAIAALTGSLVLAGCVNDPGPKTVPPRTASVPTEAAARGFEKYYQQAVAWEKCEESLECATITVPLDWTDSKSEPIKLALSRKTATDPSQRLGAIVINPGGPGGSGTGFVTYATSFMSKDLLKRYDVVGFDPRGVKKSDAVVCVDDQGLDDFRAFSFPSTPQGAKEGEKEAGAFAAACKTETGELLGKVDTMSAVHDMDVIRSVLAAEKLDYLGYSYGTYLGAHYAEEYPERVGHFVLDGAMDPALGLSQLTIDQTTAFEAELRSYVEDCQAGARCPLTGNADEGMKQIKQLLDRSLTNPLPTGDKKRPLTRSLAFSGIIGPLYEDRVWSMLTQALDAALTDNSGTGLLQIADMFADREESGKYTSNSLEANLAINCLDYPERPTMADMTAQAKELERVAPTLGSSMAYSGVTCNEWPYPGTGAKGALKAAGAPAIVVIGTAHDPATPYKWAQALSSQLESGVLVSYSGHGHTAYGRSNACVSDAVEKFFLSDEVPRDGLEC